MAVDLKGGRVVEIDINNVILEDPDEWAAVCSALLAVKFLITEDEARPLVVYLGERLGRAEAMAVLTAVGYAGLRGVEFGPRLLMILEALGYFSMGVMDLMETIITIAEAFKGVNNVDVSSEGS